MGVPPGVGVLIVVLPVLVYPIVGLAVDGLALFGVTVTDNVIGKVMVVELKIAA